MWASFTVSRHTCRTSSPPITSFPFPLSCSLIPILTFRLPSFISINQSSLSHDTTAFPQGESLPLLCLDGLCSSHSQLTTPFSPSPHSDPSYSYFLSNLIVPIFFMRNQYHTPFRLWIPHRFPIAEPIAYVLPAQGMTLNPQCRLLDPNEPGRVPIPRWDPASNNGPTSLTSLLDAFQAAFSATPPLMGSDPRTFIQFGGPNQATLAAPPQIRSNSASPSASSSSARRISTTLTHPPPPGPSPPPPSPQPPVKRPPELLAGEPIMADGDDPVKFMEITFRAQAIVRAQEHMKPIGQKIAAEGTRKQDLEARGADLARRIAELTSYKDSLTSITQKLQEHGGALDLWIECASQPTAPAVPFSPSPHSMDSNSLSNGSSSSNNNNNHADTPSLEEDVDALALPADQLTSQVLDAVSSLAALEDLQYHLRSALFRGQIPLEDSLKV